MLHPSTHRARESTRKLLALPAQLGGLGLINPAASEKEQGEISQQISATLVDPIINQDHQLDDCRSVQQSIKRRIQQTNRTIVPQGINCQKYKYSYVA